MHSQFQRTHQRTNLSNQSHIQQTLPSKQLIEQKMREILDNRRMFYLRDRMYEYYGQNFPINYQPHYNFQQNWQQKTRNAANPAEYRIKFRSKLQELAYLLIVICNSLAIWLCTVHMAIDRNAVGGDLEKAVLICVVAAQGVDLWLKLSREFKCLIPQKFIWLFMCTAYKQVIYIVYFSLKSALDFAPATSHWIFVIEAIILFLLYLETKNLYNSLRVANYSSQFQYHFKLVDLIINLLIIGHLMALLLYSSTNAGYETTWLSKINIEKEQTFVLYLYSLYFSTTTILTVGYGDLSPTNPIETATVIFVQICGIALLAYIINEIGFCLSSLRKNQEFLEKDFLVLQKMKKQYCLQEDLMQRINQYLVNSYQKAYQLTPEEEQGVIKKLNEQLRNEIQKSSLISIVKSSLFLVCRWSHSMQKAVSLKLVHTLFSPNDSVYQPVGKQRLYIIRSGKIGVYAGLKIRKNTKKLLKTIENKLDNETSKNCYGYTAVISSRPTILEGIAKQFSAAYYITKQHFLQCVFENLADFQYFHELKNKIELTKIAQSLEVPFLVSSKQHYHPNRHTIILKESGKGKRNSRSTYIRASFAVKYTKRINLQEGVQANQNISQETITRDSKDRNSAVYNTLISNDNVEEIKSVQQLYQKLELTERYAKSAGKYQKTESTQFKRKGIKFQEHFAHLFESGREYRNYYARQNRKNVLSSYEKEFCMVSHERKIKDRIVKNSSACYKRYLRET